MYKLDEKIFVNYQTALWFDFFKKIDYSPEVLEDGKYAFRVNGKDYVVIDNILDEDDIDYDSYEQDVRNGSVIYIVENEPYFQQMYLLLGLDEEDEPRYGFFTFGYLEGGIKVLLVDPNASYEVVYDMFDEAHYNKDFKALLNSLEEPEKWDTPF